MFQNSKISILLRIVCLVTFVTVIIFNNSFITLALLTIFFYLFTRLETHILLYLWYIITIIAFLVSYFINDLVLLKVILIIGLSAYFLINPYGKKAVKNKKMVLLDKYSMRFKNLNIKRKDVIDLNLINAIYITVHLFILFVTIMVG